MENWNENDWQGRRKEQVESSSKIGFYSMITLFVLIVGGFFINFISTLLN
jgi:hypothetical protein